MNLETRRQLIHMSGIAIPFYILWSHDTWGLMAPVASLILSALLLQTVSTMYLKKIKIPVVSRIIDATERPEVIQMHPARGALMFLTGSTITLVLFSFDITIAAAAIAVLAVGDSISTLAGKKAGRHKIPYNKEKSVEGTLAGFTAALVATGTLVSIPYALAGALAGMLAESLPLPIDDNVAVPIAAAASMSAASLIF